VEQEIVKQVQKKYTNYIEKIIEVPVEEIIEN
jgi:hypothetical protein